MNRRLKSRCAGFTLVELLIALSLIALMLTMLFGALRLANRTWDAVEDSVQTVSDQRLSINFIRRILAQALPVRAGRSVFFSGQKDAMEFVAEMPPHLGLGGAYLIRLEVHGSANKQNLILKRWMYHPDILDGGDDIPEWKPLAETGGFGELDASGKGGGVGSSVYNERVLLSDYQRISFSYHAGDGEGEGWQDEWQEAASLPGLIKCECVRADSAAGVELVAALPMASTAKFFM